MYLECSTESDRLSCQNEWVDFFKSRDIVFELGFMQKLDEHCLVFDRNWFSDHTGVFINRINYYEKITSSKKTVTSTILCTQQ